MLIVAMPKSASTSLMVTLGKLHNLRSQQVFFPENAIPSNLRLLHKYHSDIREICESQVCQFSTSRQYYKQHVPPTDHNLRLLFKIKKVILLREPEDIIEAYYRAEMTGVHETRKEFSSGKTIADWHDIAKRKGLLGDLRWFYDTWTDEGIRHTDANLIVHYEDLVHNATKIVNDIEQHFGLPRTGVVNLSKQLYSRYPLYLMPFRRLKRLALLLINRYPKMYSALRFIKKAIRSP